MKLIKKFAKSDDGAVSLEYAIVAAMISLAGLKSIHCITCYVILPIFEDASKFIAG